MSHQTLKRIEEESQRKQLEKYRYLSTISETRKAKEKEALKTASESVLERTEAARKFNERQQEVTLRMRQKNASLDR